MTDGNVRAMADTTDSAIRLVPTFCRICEPLCGLVAEVDADGTVRDLRPDRDHPVSEGFACHKGLAAVEAALEGRKADLVPPTLPGTAAAARIETTPARPPPRETV